MKNNILVIGLLTLIIGLFVGYTLAPRTMMDTETMVEMHDEMEEKMGEHEEELISGDGVMQHAMEEMMRPLMGKTGEEYEKAFLEMMIVHHIGAIEMAEDLLEQTDRPELVKMGNDIITVQTEEVEMMKGWLNDWFSS
jgi:uncharacterized protein (DUF305 family)